MATDLRELNEACARAMGFTRPEPRGFWRDPNGKMCSDPYYATDAACIPEMWAWLWKPHVVAISVSQVENDVFHAVANMHYPGLSDENAYGDEEGRGATIQEALARLVCAVAALEP